MVLVVEGLSSYHFVANESMFPHVTNNLKYRLEVATPAMCGGSIVEDLAAVPLTGIQSKNLIKRTYIYIYIYKNINYWNTHFILKTNVIYLLIFSGYGCLETALETDRNIIKLLRTTFPVPSDNANGVENNSKVNLPATDKFDRTKLLLSLEQMVRENYPVPLKGTLAQR